MSATQRSVYFRCGNCGNERHGMSVSWWTDCEECGESDWKEVDDAE